VPARAWSELGLGRSVRMPVQEIARNLKIMGEPNYRIVITGGGSGIGAALALDLASEGHSVVICGRRLGKLKQIASNSGRVSFFKCDVSKEKNVIAFASFVAETYDSVDVLINCAGLFGAIGRFDETDTELWQQTIAVNLFGTYLVTKHFLPFLLRSNVRKIINFSGGGAFGAFPNFSAYAVSKAAVVRLSENVALELGDLGVQVNCVAPGFVATEIHEATLRAGQSKAGAKHFEETKSKLEAGAVPLEIPVNCVKYLISSASNGLSGKTISANFDKWESEEFREAIPAMTKSDLYTLRRINLSNLDANDPLRKVLT